eukprot:GGOE01023303.1.p1 GENE.GGOE01023303.1~~GGOE01023303.1.p1  ORF type:complete len:298 (+),score=47.52 GGOE01023303.1:171-1064(+)
MDPALRVMGQRNSFAPSAPKGGSASSGSTATITVGRAGLAAALNALKQPSKVEERLSIVKKGRQRRFEGDAPSLPDSDNSCGAGSTWQRLDHISPPKTVKPAEGDKAAISSKGTALLGSRGRANSLVRLSEKAEARRPPELEHLRRASDSEVLRRSSELEAIRVLSPQDQSSGVSGSPKSEVDLNFSISMIPRSSVMSAPGVCAIADCTVPGCITYPIVEDPNPEDAEMVDDLIGEVLADAFFASPIRHLTAHMALHLPVTPKEARLSPLTDSPHASPRLSPQTPQRGSNALPFSPR